MQQKKNKDLSLVGNYKQGGLTIITTKKMYTHEELRQELIAFAKWHQKDEMQREKKELWTKIVDRFLNKT